MRTHVEPYRWSILDLATAMATQKIYLDDAFQSYHRWATENNQKYMKSFINGKAPTPIYIADIQKCMQSVITKYDKNHPDVAFYQDKLDKGYKYITIDGNNRRRCIADFFLGCFNDTFGLILGDYELPCGSLRQPNILTVTNDSKLFADIDPSKQLDITNMKIIVNVIETGTREDLAELFDAINTGMVLNAQEKRNCKMYKFAELVRGSVKKYKEKLFKIYGEYEFNRRYVDEFIVDLAVICARGLNGIGPASRDKAYSDNTPEEKSFKSADKIVGQIASLMQFREVGDKLFICSKKTNTNVLDLAILLAYMNENQIIYTDKEKFFHEFCDLQTKRIGSTKILWQKRVTDRKSPDYGKPTGTDDRTYAGIQRSNQKSFVLIRQNELIASLSDFSDGLIITRDKVRNFTRDVAFLLSLWRKQDGKCPASGRVINCKDILNGQLIEVDHKYPWSKGGKTVEENAALLYKKENRSKSASIVDFNPQSFEIQESSPLS